MRIGVSAELLHRAISGLSLVEFDQPDIHDRIRRAEETADNKPRQVVRGTSTLIVAILRIVVVAGFLVVLSPLMLPLMLLAGLPIAALSAKLAGENFRFYFQVTPLERRRRYLGSVLTSRAHAAELRLFGLSDHFSRLFQAASEERHEELRVLTRRQARSLLVGHAAFVFVIASSLGVIAWLFSTDRLSSAGVLTAVVALVSLVSSVGEVGGPIAELSEVSLFLQDQKEFYGPMAERTNDAVALDVAEPLEELVIDGVSFRYPSGWCDAVSDVTITLRRGEIVALVGANGSGKTTVAKLAGFLFKPTAGRITWNGINADQLDVASVRDRITVVFQDHVTYHLSIEENIHLGDVQREVDHEEIVAAAKAAGVDEFASSLPNGYATPLGPEFLRGTALSGGQEQRLCLARSLYRGLDLVILDEPTAALDPIADSTLMANLRELMNGRTSLVISHRFSNVKQADRIYVLDGGRVVEQGSHDELMARGALYAEMYALQAQPFAGEADPVVATSR